MSNQPSYCQNEKDCPSDKKTPVIMSCCRSYVSKFPEDVSVLSIHSPLLLSLMSSEDEQHLISNLRYGVG